MAAAASGASAQSVGDRISSITTLIVSTSPGGNSMGTGFFYHQLEDRPPSSEPRWLAIERMWLVTNRHVVLGPPEHEALPSSLTFHLRRVAAAKLEWLPIALDTAEIVRRSKCHSNPRVDVCAIEVLDLVTARIKANEALVPWSAVSKNDLPGEGSPAVDTGDDVLIVGYPRGYYDDVNLVLIVKSGIIASKWNAPFGGNPVFMIDAKLFPGSSGSIVITKPRDVALIGGQIKVAKDKQFNFLGVYSGEPRGEGPRVDLEDFVIVRKVGFNLGVVWYGRLIEEVINAGVPPNPSS